MARGPWDRIPLAIAVVALLGVAVLALHPGALSVPLVGDDYAFIEKTAHASFGSLGRRENLFFQYYRPWSRELHNWVLLHLAGPSPAAFHAASIALWLAAMTLYFQFVRRWSGPRRAGAATAALAASAAWGVLIVWASGVQELWMQVFSLLALLAFARRRDLLALGAFALALASKETAVVVPGVLAAFAAIVQRDRPRTIALRLLPSIALVLAWAWFRGGVGGGIVAAATQEVLPGLHRDPTAIAGLTLASVLNLDAWPRPEHGWSALAFRAALVAVSLAMLVLVTWRAPENEAERARGRVALFGAVWALAGWAPLFVPSVGWHGYYALFGAMGAWLALAQAPLRHAALPMALVAGLAVLGAGRVATPTEDWGTAWFQRRAATFTAATREQLARLHPSFPRHARLFFTDVPSGTGLVPGGNDSPALRTWYADSTLSAAFWALYRARAAGMPAGADHFFRYDPVHGWVEVTPDQPPPSRGNDRSRWVADHERLATVFARGDDWPAARAEYRRLVAADPTRPEYANDLAVCLESLGDSTAARTWYARAEALRSTNER